MKETLANKKLLYGLTGLALIAVLAIVGYFVLRKDNSYIAPVKYTNESKSNTASSSANTATSSANATKSATTKDK